PAQRRCRFPHHRSISAADAQAPCGHTLRHSRRVQVVRDHRLCQGISDGLGVSAYAFVPSRGRGFCAPEGGAQGAGLSAPSMPEFSTTNRVRHNASDMFDLVADVERYPEFVPLCSRMKLLSRKEHAEGVVVIVADMTVAYKLIRETFRSRATL